MNGMSLTMNEPASLSASLSVSFKFMLHFKLS